jgi:UDP-glucose 4-epimerase
MVYIIYGGAGYIGSHLIAQLLQAEKSVICIDNLTNSFSSIFSEMPNTHLLTLVTEDNYTYSGIEKVEGIFHFAAMKSVPESCKNPIEYYENNIGITCRALEMMRDTGCDVFVFSGSASVYGSSSPGHGSSETDALNPLSPYGRTKVACENLIQDFAATQPGKRFFSLRYFNPYGGTETPKKKEHQNLLPALMSALESNTPFKVYGTDYQTPDGTCVRDFIHISDLIKGHVACLSYKRPGYHVFNLGSGKGTSVLQVITAFKSKYPRLLVETHPRRQGDAPFLFANITKARTELGWSPQVEIGPRVL